MFCLIYQLLLVKNDEPEEEISSDSDSVSSGFMTHSRVPEKKKRRSPSPNKERSEESRPETGGEAGPSTSAPVPVGKEGRRVKHPKTPPGPPKTRRYRPGTRSLMEIR